MHALGNGAQPLWPVEHGIEAGHDRQQRLRGADVGRGLFAPDMLLAGLQAEPVRPPPARIDRNAHNAARHGALQIIAAGHEGGMRPAIAYRHAKSLRRSHGDIGPHRARFLQQAQRQKISGDDGQRLFCMKRSNLRGEILHMAIGAGILEDRAEDRRSVDLFWVADDAVDAQRAGAGLDHGNGLRVAVPVNEERARLGLGAAFGHGHGFGRRRRLVQQAGIGNGQAGQVGDHRLVVQQRLEPPLRDFRLIGGIGCVPGGVFQNVALDRRRGDGAVIALPDQAGHHPVLCGHLAHFRQQLVFGQRRPGQCGGLPDTGGNGLRNQRVQAGHADHRQHIRHFLGRGADVAAVGEIIRIVGGRGKGHRMLRSDGGTGFGRRSA